MTFPSVDIIPIPVDYFEFYHFNNVSCQQIFFSIYFCSIFQSNYHQVLHFFLLLYSTVLGLAIHVAKPTFEMTIIWVFAHSCNFLSNYTIKKPEASMRVLIISFDVVLATALWLSHDFVVARSWVRISAWNWQNWLKWPSFYLWADVLTICNSNYPIL